MQYIEAAQVLLTMRRLHIQSTERWTSDRWDLYTLKRRKAELVSTYITL